MQVTPTAEVSELRKIFKIFRDSSTERISGFCSGFLSKSLIPSLVCGSS